jgi:hypothetical protein
MTNPALDQFGRLIVEEVRDRTIHDWNKIVDGQMQGRTGQAVREMLTSFNPEQIGIIHRLIPQIVDGTLHFALWNLSETEWLSITVQAEDGSVINLRDISDGLHGDLLDWILRFSNESYELKARPSVTSPRDAPAKSLSE